MGYREQLLSVPLECISFEIGIEGNRILRGQAMLAQSLILHVRVDDQLKAQASQALAGVGVGLTLSKPVRILLTRVATGCASRPPKAPDRAHGARLLAG